jgi:hypothetical protein
MSEGVLAQRIYDEAALNRGWLVAKYAGVDFIGDRHLPTYSGTHALNKIYFLNENYLDLVTHSGRNFKFSGMLQPTDQDVSVGRFLWAGNMTCSAPKHCGCLYNFAWAAA